MGLRKDAAITNGSWSKPRLKKVLLADIRDAIDGSAQHQSPKARCQSVVFRKSTLEYEEEQQAASSQYHLDAPHYHVRQQETMLTSTLRSLAPYERRVIELLRNSKDKRARKLAKKRVRLNHIPRLLDQPI